jgi:ATP-binding cassette subfamily B protein
MVLQKNVLFSGTIEENLKWGDLNATHEEVVEAAKYAQAHDFISSFPKGYQTDLGQGGVNVSGGQKQRLCIARALLKKPQIIILDDSTSAVDTDTDKRIRNALKERLAGMTTIIIAQRVASVMDADKIIVMKDGMIEYIGKHDELLEKSEEYRDLYQTQMQGVSQ